MYTKHIKCVIANQLVFPPIDWLFDAQNPLYDRYSVIARMQSTPNCSNIN